MAYVYRLLFRRRQFYLSLAVTVTTFLALMSFWEWQASDEGDANPLDSPWKPKINRATEVIIPDGGYTEFDPYANATMGLVTVMESTPPPFYRVGTTKGSPRIADSGITNASSVKTIVLWNKFHERADYGLGQQGMRPFQTGGCRVRTCRVTSNRAALKSAHAVVFHARAIWELTSPASYPQRAHRDQIYVFLNLESPIRTWDYFIPFTDLFNLTMTYRKDADIPVSVSGDIVPTSPSQKPYSLPDLRSKSGFAVWLISQCDKVGSQRWAYGMELTKYIPIDIYGACGNYSCPRSIKDNCMGHFEKVYKFYLSFENSVCRDYATEKIRKPLTYDLVPVALGGTDYAHYFPQKSVINALDYRSPYHLANYLKHLDANDEEYLEYFKWKQHWRIKVESKTDSFCRLCEILHNRTYPFKSRYDISRWHQNESQCVVGVENLNSLLGL